MYEIDTRDEETLQNAAENAFGRRDRVSALNYRIGSSWCAVGEMIKQIVCGRSKSIPGMVSNNAFCSNNIALEDFGSVATFWVIM